MVRTVETSDSDHVYTVTYHKIDRTLDMNIKGQNNSDIQTIHIDLDNLTKLHTIITRNKLVYGFSFKKKVLIENKKNIKKYLIIKNILGFSTAAYLIFQSFIFLFCRDFFIKVVMVLYII